MPRMIFACLALAASSSFAASGTSANLLGLNYSEWLASTTQMATDASGALYLLGSCPVASGSASCVTKLSADGKTMVWQNVLSFQTDTMAVSPSGDVFVVPVFPSPATQSSDTSLYVAKLAAGGAGVAWRASAGFLPPGNILWPAVLAADAQGRVYVAALSGTTVMDNAGVGVTTVVRFNAAGAAIDYSATMTGAVTAIGADGSGAVVLAGSLVQACFVARVTANGSMDYYTTLSQNEQPALALDARGNAVIVGSQGGFQGLLQRLNSAGAVTVSTTVTASTGVTPLGLDAAGNAYVLAVTPQVAPLRSTLAPCLAT